MKFSTAIAGLLGAGSVIAAALTGHPDIVDTDLMRRGDSTATGNFGRHSRAVHRGQGSQSSLSSRSNPVEDSPNWAGGVAYLPSGGLQVASAFFVVPNPAMPSGGSTKLDYFASAWVGIDGYEGCPTLLQTGVDFYIQNGKPGFDAWYEWVPQLPVYFNSTEYPIAVGDWIMMTVWANNKNTGWTNLQNMNKGWSVTQNFTTPQGSSLCLTSADFIIETQFPSNPQMPLPNFGTAGFQSIIYGFTNGSRVFGADNTFHILDIEDDVGNVWTNCGLTHQQGINCTYLPH